MLEGFVNDYKETGWLPRWVSIGEVNCMPSTLIDAVFADAAVKGLVSKELLSTAYTAKAGSTIVTLSNSYLKTLNKGTHTLTMHFMDGQTASANFYVVSEAKPAWNPQTGDMIMVTVGVMGVSAVALVVLLLMKRRKYNKN
jgi:LPXTG-motif cell wall-anchored protein